MSLPTPMRLAELYDRPYSASQAEVRAMISWINAQLQAKARTTDPSTSHEAARNVRVKMTKTRAAVLAVLAELGEATDWQLEEAYAQRVEAYGLPWQSSSGLRTRRAELVKMGLVTDSGRVWLHNGNKHKAWKPTVVNSHSA